MGRNAIVYLKNGSKRSFSITKTINVVAVNEMRQLLDTNQLQPSYSWDWLVKTVLEVHGLKQADLKDYSGFYTKVKLAFYLVKNPHSASFNSTVDTMVHPEIGRRIVKLGVETPDEVKQELMHQKEERISNQIDTHNLRIDARKEQIGFGVKKLELRKKE